MKEPLFPPAPWVEDDTEDGYWVVRMDESHALGWNLEDTDQTDHAILTLIAAAPDLFRMLNILTRDLGLVIGEVGDSLSKKDRDLIYENLALAKIILNEALDGKGGKR